MPDPLWLFPDVQRLLVDDLEALAGSGHTAIETPVDLEGKLPFVRVMRTGGPADLVTDYPTIEVDVFAATYTDGVLLAEKIRQRLVGPPPPVRVIDRCRCDIGPRELPWGDGIVRRFGATYSMSTRRRLAS